MSVDRLLAWSADRFADRIAISTDACARTYRQIDERANALANAMMALGVGKGDRIGVLIGNQAEYPEAEFAIVKAGAVRVPMLITSSGAEIRHFVEFAETKLVIASGGGFDRLRELVGTGQIRLKAAQIVAVGGAQSEENDFESLIASSSTVRPHVDLSEDDLYAVRFTGGTTGLPKGVMMDHRCMTNVINNVLLNWDIGSDEVVCHIHPLSHASGKILHTWWMRGARQIILPSFGFDPERLLQVIERERVTTIFMIPTAINMLLDCPALSKYDTGSLRRIIYGGAPMSVGRIREALDAFGPVLYQIYGSSEAPNLLTCLSAQDHVFEGAPPDRLRSAGRPGYNVEVRIVDDAGGDCPVGENGEIISRGPHTMRGYWKDDALTRERKIDGWVHTGDIGQWDSQGYLYVVDRKDDVIITGGFNVWPAEVENALGAHPGVAEAVVFGVADDKWGEAVTAMVVAKTGAALTVEALRTHLAALLPRHKVPKNMTIVSSPIPKSAVGKILRRKAADDYRKTQEAKPQGSGLHDEPKHP